MCTIVESQQITGCKRLPIDRCRSDLDARKFSKITNSPFPNSSFSLNYSLLKADLDSTLNFKEIANCVATTPDTSPFEEVMPVPLITDIPPMITEMAASQLGVGDTELFISGNDLMEKVVGDSNGTGGEIPLPGPQQYTPSLTKCEEKPELQNESATASTENAKKEKKSNQILFLEELVINLKHENETLKNEFSQLKERKSKEIECLEIEIDVLNELVAEGTFSISSTSQVLIPTESRCKKTRKTKSDGK